MSLIIKGLSFGYDRRPLFEKLSFDLDQGKVLSVVGPSGSGKTSLLLTIAGIVEPWEGRIERPQGYRAFVPQDHGLYPWKRVWANVTLGIDVSGRRRDLALLNRACELFAQLGLSGFENRWPAELSGGQRQRVAIARALAAQPSLLLMDEPFASLDCVLRRDLSSELKTLVSKQGIACVFVTHDIEDAIAMDGPILAFNGKGSYGLYRYHDTPKLDEGLLRASLWQAMEAPL